MEHVDKLTLNDIVSQELTEAELAVYRVLKPYIGRCLTLNHDINNPLAGIIGYCEVLLMDSDKLTESQQGYLQQIFQCAERIKAMVDDLCEEKIALNNRVDLSSVTEAYNKVGSPKE